MAASLTSDTYHEFSCTPCSEDDVNIEPVKFCVNCSQYFCKACLKVHNRLPDLRQHQLLDKGEFRRLSTTATKGGKPDLPTETCQNHHGKLVDMYCEDHDQIGCNVCMTLDHRQCKHLHYIPDIASSRLSQDTIQAVLKNLSNRLDEFNSLKKDRLDTKTRVANEKDACLKSIKERRKAIDEYLEQKETALSNCVYDKHEEISNKLDDDLKTCDDSINLLDKMNGKLNTGRNNQTSQTFIDIKRAEHAMKKTGVKLRDCEGNRNGGYTLIYEEGPSLREMLSPDTLFGNVKSVYRTPNALNKESDIDIRFNSDKSVCDCNCLCQLPDGTIIITDWNNKKLKSLKYDNTYTQSDSLSLSNPPWGVCTVSDNEVAVTEQYHKKVSIVSVSSKMVVKSSFSVDSRCNGIAYSDGYLYVGHDTKLTVYDLQGKCMKTFSEGSNGTELFQDIYHVCINPAKQQIIVADNRKGIVIVDKSGNLVAEYKYPNQYRAFGVCLDDSGNVYIADYWSKQLLVLDMNGTATTLLDNLNDKPTAVVFDKHRQRFLVLFNKKYVIQSFSLQYKII